MNRFLSIALILLLSGCHLGPRYVPPNTDDAPEEWKSPQPNCECVPQVDYWWEVFNDPILNELEDAALKYNPSLFAALERVLEARAIAGVDRADLFPQLNLNPSYTDTGLLFRIYLPPNFIPGEATIPTIYRVHEMQYTLPLNLSYELDLWGKIRGVYDSAVFSAQAEAEAFHTAILTLTTDLANSYFQMRTSDAQIELLTQTESSYQKALDLNQERFQKGIVTLIDVTQATTALANVQAEIKDNMRQRTNSEHQIAILTGVPPSELCLDFNPLIEAPPCIPPSLPSDILLQRPDIAQAERTMASEHALIGSAYASFFPSIDLTGTLGYSSPDFRDFLKWKSRLWSFGGNLSLPIFDGGRNCSNLALAFANFREASDNYRSQVLTAFQEVEDALNNLEKQNDQYASLEIAANAATKTVSLSRSRYLNGVTTYLEVTVNEQSELNAKRSLVALLGVEYLSTVQLIKALGGSWKISEERTTNECQESDNEKALAVSYN